LLPPDGNGARESGVGNGGMMVEPVHGWCDSPTTTYLAEIVAREGDAAVTGGDSFPVFPFFSLRIFGYLLVLFWFFVLILVRLWGHRSGHWRRGNCRWAQ